MKAGWSTRQLERQINTFFYEGLLSSKNKEKVAAEIQTSEAAKTPKDIIRDPYVLEFPGLNPSDDFYESDLEQALITHLQKFLLELGRGFSFVARQKRITFDGRHFWTPHPFQHKQLQSPEQLNILARRNHNSGKLETGIPDAGNQLNSA